MGESFAELFEESLKQLNLSSGAVIVATVETIGSDMVTVNAGLKSEAAIPLKEFINDQGELEVAEGDQVDVVVVNLEDGFGNTTLSRLKARQAEAWTRLERAHEQGDTVNGVITGKVRGGFTVELDSIRAFLPGSQVDLRPLRDASHLEGPPLEFKVLKLDSRRNNVVVSRRAVLEEAHSAEREALLGELSEGAVLSGVVKNLTDYGAFVDLGGIDGLLHITDLAWRRVRHPSELLSVGDEIRVKVLKYDQDKQRVSLGMKQLEDDPWSGLKARYPRQTKLQATVTNITDYGCFAEIEPGIEGLVHVSEMDWTNRNVHPSKVVQLGQEIEVMVLDIDADRRRISLGMKQCQSNPWELFASTHKKGDRVRGTIKTITDFGVFVGLDGGIDGLVHLSDLSWEQSGEEVARNYHKGDEVEALILQVDTERERISLGIKQLDDDPFSSYAAGHDRGEMVSGRVVEVDMRVALLELAEGVTAVLKLSEFAEAADDLRTAIKVGDMLEASILSVDRKKRQIVISTKALESARHKEAMQAVRENQDAAHSPTTIGDLIKAQLEKKN
ncbi:30S ribosomal protein S1 [Motiliproteus sediminis]|uniref:30S ribosomal protein S1 n=1 Tax=Motiliproteus sediminis TaxID=1468178 RepID=UPI001AEFCEA9|nr:30S ribosomal protein S1 [Motiliproteus sediminis]